MDLKQCNHFLDPVTLELVCHDEQNSCQSFSLGASIARLGRFKAQKVHKEDHLANFKPDSWQTGFLDAAKNGTIIKSNYIVVSKSLVQLFS